MGGGRLGDLVCGLQAEVQRDGATARDVRCAVLDSLGDPDEAEQWLGDPSDFWNDAAPPPVVDAIARLPRALAARDWRGALACVASIRSLHLVRLAASLSRAGATPADVPLPPVPRHWPGTDPPPAKALQDAHVEVLGTSNPRWSDFLLRLSVADSVALTLLDHNGVELTSPVMGTHPALRQSSDRKTTRISSPTAITVLLSGRVRDTGATLIRVPRRHAGYSPLSEEGLLNLSQYIITTLRIEERELLLERVEGNTVVFSFASSTHPKELQKRLVRHQSNVWDLCVPSPTAKPDVQVDFPGKPPVYLTLSGRPEPSPEVAEEVLRQAVYAIVEHRAPQWRQKVARAVTSSHLATPFALEVLWCAVGGSVDLDDPNEFSAMLQSLATQTHVANPRPADPLPHRRHHLYAPDTFPAARRALTALNLKMLQLLPWVDADGAHSLGVVHASRTHPPPQRMSL